MPTTPIPGYLNAILDEVRDITDGENADYIETLRNADPDKLALALCTRSGNLYSVGDDDYEFSIQSTSKPFVYAIALDQGGVDNVHSVVGMEPSGEAFNELSLDKDTKRPSNPMINAGAIAVNQLVAGTDATVEERSAMVLDEFSKLAGRPLRFDEEIIKAERDTADRNMALAHMLRVYDIIEDDVDDAVTSYIRQCSIMVTVKDLAVMAATLANGGVQPVTGERVLSSQACRLTQSVMASAGMYDGSGKWMSTVGIPAKSGVAGGLIGTLPGQLGAASLSPRLNEKGNSVRGVEIFRRLSKSLGLHMMGSHYYSAPGIRSVRREGETNVVRLQGMINFTAAEQILHDLVERELVGDELVLDFSHVTSFNLAGRRLIKEGLRQFREDGFDVAVYDPDNAMPDYEFSDGTHVESIHDFYDSFTVSASTKDAYSVVSKPQDWWEGDEAGEFDPSEFTVDQDEEAQRIVLHSEPMGEDFIFDFDEDEDGSTRVHLTHRGLRPNFEEAAERLNKRIRQRLEPLINRED